MPTYYVRYRFHVTGKEVVRQFDTRLARALDIIAMTAWADLLAEWESDECP